jgi:uncharacterized protein (DUF983 family)
MCADKINPNDQSHDHKAHPHKPGLIWSILTNRCSRCRRGKLYLYRNPYNLKHFMQMPEKCPVCGQPFEIEVGFWFGTGFVSYGLSVAVCVASFIAWKVLIGMSLHDNRLFWWIGVNAVLLLALQPILMRLSRTIWLNFFVWYDPYWKEKEVNVPERTNLDLKNDW